MGVRLFNLNVSIPCPGMAPRDHKHIHCAGADAEPKSVYLTPVPNYGVGLTFGRDSNVLHIFPATLALNNRSPSKEGILAFYF